MSQLIGTSKAIVVKADGSGTQVIPTPATQLLVLDNFNRTVSSSSTAGFGVASSGNIWSNAGPDGGITPATHNISCDGSNGIISVVGGGGIGENSWFSSLAIPPALQQAGAAREIYVTWYWTLTAASALTTTHWYFGLHGLYSTTTYATWSLPSGADGYDPPTGNTFYYVDVSGARYIDTRGNGSSFDTAIPQIVVGTPYAAEIHISDSALVWECRHWAISSGRPATPTFSQTLTDTNQGPYDGCSVGLGVSNSGTPNATLSMQEIDITLAVPGG